MQPNEYINAARVPESIKAQAFGLWRIEKRDVDDSAAKLPARAAQDLKEYVGFQTYTLLFRISIKTLHTQPEGEVVMDDSLLELRRHLPIWIPAAGRILISGLGLGCVARGLQAKPEVEHLTIVEVDSAILERIGPEFERDPRIRLIHGDALKVNLTGERFDYAWHDIWTEGPKHLHLLHAELMAKFRDQVDHQGAWRFPRFVKRRLPAKYLR